MNVTRLAAAYADSFKVKNNGAFSTVIGSIARDRELWGLPARVAYALATFKWETADSFKPITEFGDIRYFDKYEPGTKLGLALGNVQTGDGYRFRGRGYVMVTGRGNYAKFDKRLGLGGALVETPTIANEHETAYRIALVGMTEGLFTGRKLSDYITGDKVDFLGARRIINGTDRATNIEVIANRFLPLVQDAWEG